MNVLSTSMLSASIQDIIGKNVSLRSRVLEEEDSIMSLLESAVSFTQLKPKAMKSRVDSSNDAVFSTERNYNCGTTYKVSYQDLASHTPLEISAEAVESCLAYSVPDTVVVRRTLKEMVNDGTLKAPKSVQVQRRDMFRNLDGAMGSEVSTTIYNLYDCANQDVLQYTKDEVAKFDTEVSRLQRAIATEESMRRHFIEAQDYNSGDIHHVNKVDLESRLLAQYNQRLKIIVASASSSGSVTDSLTTVRQDAFDAVKAIEDEKRDMLANIDKDLASLGDLRTQQKAMQDETMSHHEQTWKKLNDFIATNTREQDTLWSEIEERALALHQNGKRRADRMKQFLDHKHRVVEATGMFETMMRVSAEYMKMLESLRSHADQCVVICGHIQEYCNDMVDVLTKRNIKKQLDDIAIAEAHAYAAVYADFVTDVGDLRTKKRAASRVCTEGTKGIETECGGRPHG
eukprot:PhF_6_TR24780/c0_g1_i2/m.34043